MVALVGGAAAAGDAATPHMQTTDAIKAKPNRVAASLGALPAPRMNGPYHPLRSGANKPRLPMTRLVADELVVDPVPETTLIPDGSAAGRVST
jgi:hypothetical protein